MARPDVVSVQDQDTQFCGKPERSTDVSARTWLRPSATRGPGPTVLAVSVEVPASFQEMIGAFPDPSTA